ncbi:hypothetical protein E4T56_gene11776 [Termitomyces sp. T112]|nr:hypothetical protein E4T56_gene11776 [Termitomyces sp. T112]KAH0585528.1 hypothetical protein H2248_008762 [Termitomyces sp. 'cryptogamus']
MSLDQHIVDPTHRYDEGGQKLWSIYVHEAEQYDHVLIDTWKVSLDSTLIFAGLFSATITAFIVESYKLLKSDSGAGDATITLLVEILAAQRVIAFANTTTTPLPPTSTNFTAPTWAIIVNVLWFLSLAGVLVAAIIITLVQQWVRDYVHKVHRYPQPLKRARMRLFLFSGVEKCKLDDVIHHIPTLLHISLLFFFIGLYVFLAKINKVVAASVGFVFLFWLFVYCFATVAPMINLSAPFKTPFSSSIFYLFSLVRQEKPVDLSASCERQAMRPPDADAARVDAQAISWTIQRSTDDGERQEFLACIPGFLGSDDGRKTWAELLKHSEVINMFLRGTADLLDVASPSHGGQINSHEVKRVSICLDALFTFLRTAANTWPSTIDISPLSKPLGQLVHASCKDNLAIKVQASCLFALHKYLAIPPGRLLKCPEDSLLSPRTIWPRGLSQKVDRGLQQVDTTRQNLEDALEVFKLGKMEERYLAESIRAHLRAIDHNSQVIVAWLRHPYAKDKAAKDVLGDWSSYFIRAARLLQTKFALDRREALFSILFENIPYMEDRSWSVVALVIMGYLRHTNVYPSLPGFPHHNSPTNSKPLEFWFPFLGEADYRWISEPFTRELLPLASALNILIHDKGVTDHVKYTSSLDHYDMMDILRYSTTSSPNLPTIGNPFSLLEAIVYETVNSFETRGIFDLVSALDDADLSERDLQTIHTDAGLVIGESLRILGEQFGLDRSSGPLLFSLSLLQKILSREQKRSPFPFSEDNMDYIVNTIFFSTLKKHNLVTPQDADYTNMIGSLEEIDSHLVPFYDLRGLYGEIQSETQREGTSMTSAAVARVPKFLKEGSCRPMDIQGKKDICARIMEGRRRWQREWMRS